MNLIQCAVPAIGILNGKTMYVLEFKVVIYLLVAEVHPQVILPRSPVIARISDVANVWNAQAKDKPFVIKSQSQEGRQVIFKGDSVNFAIQRIVQRKRCRGITGFRRNDFRVAKIQDVRIRLRRQTRCQQQTKTTDECPQGPR